MLRRRLVRECSQRLSSTTAAAAAISSMPAFFSPSDPPPENRFDSLSDDIFNPNLYAATRKPLDAASPIPGYCYTSREWFAREVDTVFRSSWVLAGRADEIPNPGDFLTVNCPGIGPVVVIRGRRGGQISAFVNICRHRGAKLLSEERGNARGGITCPYHAWMYDPDTGALKGAPRMCAPSKKKKKKKKEEEEEEELGACGQPSPSFDKADFPLHPVRLREVSGFLFVGSATAAAATATTGQGGDTNAANAAPCDLSVSLGNLPRLLFDQWPMEDLVTVGRATYDVKCNWKFLLENTSETYHTAYVHRSTLGAMDSSTLGAMKSETESGVGSDESSSDEVPWGDWSGVYVPGDRSIVPLKGEDAPFPAFQRKTFFVSVFPTLQVNLTHDCAWWMRMLPTSEDRTLVTQGFLFPRATTELPGFQEKLEPYLRRWHLAVVEDNEISENQQLGAGSFEASFPGPAAYADLEFGVHAFHNYLLDHVVGKPRH